MLATARCLLCRKSDERAEVSLSPARNDFVVKVTAEKLWNKNAQQLNRGEWILESTLRLDP